MSKNESCWILNTYFKVRPSIYVQEGKVPYVLTYRDQNNGTSLRMIQPCHQKFYIIPEDITYKIRHSVINRSTMNTRKSSGYSPQFHIHGQLVSSNGICTCSVTNFGHLNFTSKISIQIKHISICNGININSFLSGLSHHKVISQFGASSQRWES